MTAGGEVVVTPTMLRDWPLPATDTVSKNGRGRVLIIGGARSTPGGVVLAGLAALRVGAGVLAMAVARSVAAPLAVAFPEAAVIGLPETADGAVRGRGIRRLADRLTNADAVLIGSGLDDAAHTTDLVHAVIPLIGACVPIVLDAFALGVLADVPEAKQLAGRLVLTPNLDEVERLVDRDVTKDQLSEALAEIADRYQAVVSCYHHIAHSDGRRWQTSTGSAGLGTSGSGDVRAGTITGLLARGADTAQAACWGTHLHATAGDRLASQIGPTGYLARELTGQLPIVLSELSA